MRSTVVTENTKQAKLAMFDSMIYMVVTDGIQVYKI